MIWLIIICLLQVNSVFSPIPNKCKWPEECQLVGDYSGKFIFKCELDSSTKIDFIQNLTNDEIEQCEINRNDDESILQFEPKILTNIVLGRNSVNFSNMIQLLSLYYNLTFTMVFNRFSGFQIDLFENFKAKDEELEFWVIEKFQIQIQNAELNFYFDSMLLETCEDFISHNLTKPQSIFITNFFYKIYLTSCPFLFSKTKIKSLIVQGVYKTFLKTNILKFHDLVKIDYDIESTINNLVLVDDIYNIDLDSELLNRDVFKKMRKLTIIGSVRFIQNDVFKPFKSLHGIEFTFENTREFFHRNGI